MSPNPELDELKLKNEELRKEVAKWKEILTVAEIRTGQEQAYVIFLFLIFWMLN